MSSAEEGLSAYELPLTDSVAPIGELEAAAVLAHDELTRQRSLALGVAVQKLALHYNGLGEPSADIEEVRATAVQLLGDLGLSRVISMDREAPLGSEARLSKVDPRITRYAVMIDAAIRERGLSQREVGRMSGVSHTHIGAARNGAASWRTTRKVAESLGLFGDNG